MRTRLHLRTNAPAHVQAAVNGKDATLMEKEREILEKDERIKKLVDNAWQKPGAGGDGAEVVYDSGQQGELAEARATIAALQVGVRNLSCVSGGAVWLVCSA